MKKYILIVLCFFFVSISYSQYAYKKNTRTGKPDLVYDYLATINDTVNPKTTSAESIYGIWTFSQSQNFNGGLTSVETTTLDSLWADDAAIDTLSVDSLSSRVIRNSGNISTNTLQTWNLQSTGTAILDTITANPLTINGRIDLNDGGNNVYVGDRAGDADDLTDNENTGIGIDALTANTSGDKNVAVGGESLEANVTGGNNTALGFSSMKANYSGSRNTAIGYLSFRNHYSGNENTAIGYQALLNDQYSIGNTALGAYSLLNNKVGNYNIGIGYNAGKLITGGATLDTSASSIFIGHDTRAYADNLINEIVIGANAIGNGSNTVTLGDDNVTDIYMSEDAGATIHTGNAELLGSISRGGAMLGTNASTHINLGDSDDTTGWYITNPSYCAILSGKNNKSEMSYSVVSGGQNNEINGPQANWSVIGGGLDNLISTAPYITISGGTNNIATGEGATCVGGKFSNATGNFSTTSGSYTTASGQWSFSGGAGTIAGGDYSVAFGSYSYALGDYSWAGGKYMQLSAAADRSFVWGYHSSAVAITTPDVFLIYPEGTLGSVGIGTKAPTAKLTVDGNKTTGNLFEAINDNDGAVGDSSFVVTKTGGIMLSADYKIIVFNDTMCGVKISTTDTVRIVPSR